VEGVSAGKAFETQAGYEGCEGQEDSAEERLAAQPEKPGAE
jgi:hypothetical protein